LLSNTKIAIQQRYLGETKLKVVVLLSRVERDKTLGEIAIPNYPCNVHCSPLTTIVKVAIHDVTSRRYYLVV
jgi:hypothetical protein